MTRRTSAMCLALAGRFRQLRQPDHLLLLFDGHRSGDPPERAWKGRVYAHQFWFIGLQRLSKRLEVVLMPEMLAPKPCSSCWRPCMLLTARSTAFGRRQTAHKWAAPLSLARAQTWERPWYPPRHQSFCTRFCAAAAGAVGKFPGGPRRRLSMLSFAVSTAAELQMPLTWPAMQPPQSLTLAAQICPRPLTRRRHRTASIIGGSQA